MSQETETTQKDAPVAEQTAETTAAPAKTDAPTEKRAPRNKPKGRPMRRRREQAPRDFEQKIISIRRVTRVVAGGRRFSFSVAMVIGDGRGSVGVGMGKAGDTALAIGKAINDAKKNMVKLNLTEDKSIAYEIAAKYKSAQITMMPNYGRGVVAGSAVRSIIELAGIKDVTAKVQTRSKNKVNIARATVAALEPFVVATGAKAVKDSLAGNKKVNDFKKKSFQGKKDNK